MVPVRNIKLYNLISYRRYGMKNKFLYSDKITACCFFLFPFFFNICLIVIFIKKKIYETRNYVADNYMV